MNLGDSLDETIKTGNRLKGITSEHFNINEMWSKDLRGARGITREEKGKPECVISWM